MIIYSGGMDSTTLLYQFKNEIKLAVSFDYGQKHNKEIEFAKYHTKNLGIKHLIIELPFISQYFKSNLLNSGEAIPHGHYEDSIMKQTVVPFRNGILLSIACGLAESNGLNKVFIANHAGDHVIYPDYRSTFIGAMNEAMAYGTYINVNINSPYQYLTKREIALVGKNLGIDYTKTWSCYKGQEFHCGICGTCIERKEALVGFDNTVYQ